MFKILALLIIASGVYLITFWAKDNLKKNQLLWFAIGLLVTGLLVAVSIQFHIKKDFKIGNSFEKITEKDLVIMKELLSIQE